MSLYGLVISLDQGLWCISVVQVYQLQLSSHDSARQPTQNPQISQASRLTTHNTHTQDLSHTLTNTI